MSYHPIMGILIFFVTIIISFLMGKRAFKRLSSNQKSAELKVIEAKNKTNNFTKPPKGDITAPDAPWLQD